MSATDTAMSAADGGEQAAAAAAAANAEAGGTAGQEAGATTEHENTQGKSSPKSPAEIAFEKADARVKAAKEAAAKKASETAADTSSQAAPDKSGGESSEDKATGEDGKTEQDKAEAGAKPGEGEEGEDTDTTDSDSTVTPPDDWSQEYKERLAALPSDEARSLVLDFYEDMNKGFNESMHKLAQLRKADEGLFQLLKDSGRSHDDVQRLVEYDQMFEEDPKQVIKRLAGQAGIDVYFDKSAAPASGEGELPEFKNAAEMAEYIRNKTLEEVEKREAERNEKAEQERAVNEAKAALKAELETASKELENFDQHRNAVLEKLATAPGLSVEEAYNLVNLKSLKQQAAEGAKAQKELAALKQKLEKQRKEATQPVNGTGTGELTEELKNLSPGERAFRKAEAKKQARQNASA